MVISKILEGTLTAGQTSISFTDSDLPNSLIRVFSSNADIIPVSRTLTGTTLTVVYDVQLNDLGVAVEIVKDGMTINDTLISDATDEALSAKQGKVLKDAIDGLTIPDDITDLSDVEVTDIEDGQVLAWDEVAQKFVNVDQSGGSSLNYSTTEHVVGKWIDNSDIYEITLQLNNITVPNNGRIIIPFSDYNLTGVNIVLDAEMFFAYTSGSNTYYRTMSSFQIASISSYGMSYYIDSNEGIMISRGNGGAYTATFVVTIRYTKS